MSVNLAVLCGRLGQDPEARATSNGKTVCNFSIATDERKKNASGEWVNVPTWHRIVVFGKTAEACQKALRKGSLVAVTGKLQYREWQDKSGAKKTTTEILANEVRFLDSRPARENEKPIEAADTGFDESDAF